MPNLIDIDPIIICPNKLKCTKRKATVKSPNMVRVQPIVRCPDKLKCPPSSKSRRGRSPTYKSRGYSPSSKSRGYSPKRGHSPTFKSRGYSPKRGISPIFKRPHSPRMYNRGCGSPLLQHGGIIIIPRNSPRFPRNRF
jgi:hypothetical protein